MTPFETRLILMVSESLSEGARAFFAPQFPEVIAELTERRRAQTLYCVSELGKGLYELKPCGDSLGIAVLFQQRIQQIETQAVELVWQLDTRPTPAR